MRADFGFEARCGNIEGIKRQGNGGLKIRIGDIILAVLIAAAAIILIFVVRAPADNQLTAIVLRDGQEIYRADLAQSPDGDEFHIDELDIIIKFEDGRVRFAASSCLDQTCVYTGWLSRAGDIAVCLPNSVIVKIEGTPSGDIDVIAE